MSDENDWLGDLPGIREIFRDGVAFIRRKALDFKGTGWTVVDNPATGRTDVSINVPALADAVAGEDAVLDAAAAAGQTAAAGASIHGGSAFVSWNESIRQFQLLGSGSHSTAGYTLRTSGASPRGAWEYDQTNNRVRLYGSPNADERHIAGDWEVPSGSTLTVPAPASPGHATRMDYVDDGDAATLSAAQGYADAGDAATLSAAQGYVGTLSGTYTPTANNVSASIDSLAFVAADYLRIGSTVFVFWRAQAQNVSSAAKSFEIDLPVAPDEDFASFRDAIGSGVMGATAGIDPIRVDAVVGTKTVRFTTNSTADSGFRDWQGSFSYRL